MAAANRQRAEKIALPGQDSGPLRKIAVRVAVAVGLIVFVAAVTYIGRDGYEDPEGGGISLLDAFYYSTVTITTTGYGDVLPVSDGARLVTTLLVTPARVLFLILLVGTTLEILAEASRHAYRVRRWRKRLNEHTVVCGYGTKGENAVNTLVGKGARREAVIVIDGSAAAIARATASGLAGIVGNAANRETLTEAGIERARSIVVAVDRDDTAVLVTLTARELNPSARIVASVREQENVHLLQQSGADGVITSSAAAGRLLGLSSETPKVTEVLEDMLTVGEGLDILEREVDAEEIGKLPPRMREGVLLGVVREGELLRFDDERATSLIAGDRLVELVRRADD